MNKIAPKIQVARVLGTPFSFHAATMISYKLNDEVKVAKRNNNKKIAKKTCPNGNSPNAAGSTINKSPGPSAGSKPNAKTTGKMASPANKDTKIFITTTVPAEVDRLTSRFKYEL